MVIQQDEHHQHNVSRATYPLPEPLSQRLKVCIVRMNEKASDGDEPGSGPPITDSVTEALTQLLGNSMEAIDTMYFATPARIRKHDAFQHRLCLRVQADVASKTLTLTDLGAGMTRADLINSLGIGRAGLQPTKIPKNGGDGNESSDSMDVDDGTGAGKGDDDDDESQTGESSSAGEEEEGATSSDEDIINATDDGEESSSAMEDTVLLPSTTKGNAMSCRSADLGGFYGALCALGTGAIVSTKSKFDDYYDFQVGAMMQHGQQQQPADEDFEEFIITRPMEEGAKLSVETGFDKFTDVRGESGTRVVIRLNQQAINEGLLNEGKLKSIIQKIIETTQYTVAFSSDEDAQAIIEASAKEAEAMIQLQKESSELDSIETDMELSSIHHHDPADSYNSVKERAKYIPVRLSLRERQMLRLVEASMHCCDYTTQVDCHFKNEARRTHQQLKGVTSILRGLVTACDYPAGQKLLEDDNFHEYEAFFRRMFEIARRHKIMNPEKMRTEYGKLVYLQQDAVSPMVRPHLSFSVKGPIESVYKFLEERGGLGVLEDKLIETATDEILPGKNRGKVQHQIRAKERAVAIIKKKYRSSRLSMEDIHLCLYSICDNNSFLNSNRVPVDKIIDFLTSHFAPGQIDDGYSLSIVSGEEGARLSHSHERQYYFALQSLTLWREIINDMFRLWAMAEEDLLSESVTYSLQDTGQGMQRVQQAPRTYRAMQQILSRVQQKVSHWVGSSVIHMGDHNVPNALSFIDKYTQVPRILGPVVSCLENVERICAKDDGIKQMVDTGFGGLDKLRMDVLHDFFRSAFDGSGADNFYDAGSCIDGRMTSAWNWCSQLPEKPFYPIFRLTGFTGFDGEFSNN